MFRSTVMHIYVQRDNMTLLLQVSICLKQFLISSRLHLSRSACHPGPPGPLIPVGAADRNANNGRWLEGARTSASHMKRHIYYQEMAFTLRRLDKPVPLCHQASILLSFAFCSISCCCLLLSSSLMLTFSFIPSSVCSRSHFSPQPHPTCHSLSFQARLPHPDRRSNSLSTASSKRFHPPSPLSSPANDVPPSIRLWCRLPRPAVVRTRQRERIMFEQFREWRNCVLRGPGEAAAVSSPPFSKPPPV